MNAHSIIPSILFLKTFLLILATLTSWRSYILSKGECLATLPGSSKKFPTRFVTLPSHNGAREPSLKSCPFKSQTPFNGVPSIHSRSDAFVPQFLSRYVNAHICVRQCRSLFYRFFFRPHPPPLTLQRDFRVARSDHQKRHLFFFRVVHCRKCDFF